MEEKEYKSAYNELTSVRCMFEKSLTNHRAKCQLSIHFCLADREGYACESSVASSTCKKLLETLRKKSAFALKLHDIDGPLPHNMEIRVQVGGITGLEKLLISDTNTNALTGSALHDDALGAKNMNYRGTENIKIIENINAVVNSVIEKYGSLEYLPYSEIIQSVVRFKGRRRRR